MVRRLDRQISAIFLKTEVFFQYHQQIEKNLQ